VGELDISRVEWHRVAGKDDLPEGRVKTVSVRQGDTVTQIALTRFDGKWGALDSACPHQGGPLGEGSIENGCLRCPWHGWDFDPITGKPPGGYDDGVRVYPVEERDDGVYIALESVGPHVHTVTDVMAETMANWGVTHVFGMVGHSNLGLADAIRRQEVAGNMTFIAIRHEGAGAFAASAYGKLTGRPAACFAIAGPGATNLLTGLWDAKVDRAPVLALTGQVQQQVFGPNNFQELPLKEAFSAVAEFSHLALPGSDHGELMSLALKTAHVKRDVAHIIFPDDVQTQPAKEGQEAGSPDGRIADAEINPPADAVFEAIRLLSSARRPVIIVGHGARFEMEGIIELAEQINAPVLTTFKGKGLIGDAPRHPLGCGVLGRSGTPVASWFMNESDVLLVFGASFSDHTGITPKKPIIQVDFERWVIGKKHPVDVGLWGEIGVTCKILRTQLKGRMRPEDVREEVAERWRIWRAEKASRVADKESRGVSSAALFDALTRLAPEDAIISVDVGNNTYSFGRYFESSGGQAVLMSGYLGSIGFGYPGAIGAWAATQTDDPRFDGRPVLAVTGDGGFGQYAWEVNTAVKYGMNITHVLLNNNELGKISKEQRAGRWEVSQTGLTNPDIADSVTSCGGLGLRVETRAGLDGALERALAYPGPSTVEVITDAELV